MSAADRAGAVTGRAPSGPWCRVGVDLASVSEVRDALAAFGDRYARRVFTDHELRSTAGRDGPSAQSLAARFAAKEAALKVLEPSAATPPWRDIEVRRRRNGSCRLRLHGRAASAAEAQGLGPMSVSLSHEAGLAVAVVVALAPHGDGATRAARSVTDDGQDFNQVERTANRRMGMTIIDDDTARIRDVLSQHARLPVDVAALGDEDDLFQAGMTSHASVNVMLALEDAFEVEFPEAMLRKSTFASVGALRRALRELDTEEVPA